MSSAQQDNLTGRLYVCATPIGNLSDMSPRAVEVLNEADLIAAEDTRNTRHLLTHFDIRTPLTSYHHFNRIEKAQELIGKMHEGFKIALVTDAGTPAISDPGQELVDLCHEEGIPVEAIPGPAACITALSVSGLDSRRFIFEGFLPQETKEKRALLKEIADETKTMIFYEAPHRLVATLETLAGVLGGDRKACLCHELTKKHESIERGTLTQICALYNDQAPKGEFVLIVAGKPQEEIEAEKLRKWEEIPIAEHVALYEKEGLDRKEAMKRAAKDRRVSKRDIYRALLEDEDDI